MYILSSLPSVGLCLQIMKYIHTSTAHFLEIRASLNLLKSICSEFTSNQNLKLFLQFILHIGNTISTIPLDDDPSQSTSGGAVLTGFRLDTLLKLRTIKSNNLIHLGEESFGRCSAISLLYFILQFLTKHQLPYLSFLDEIQFFQPNNVNGYHRYAVEALTNDYHDLVKDYREKKKIFEEIIQLQDHPCGDEKEENGGTPQVPFDAKLQQEMQKGRYHVEKYFLEVCLLRPTPALL